MTLQQGLAFLWGLGFGIWNLPLYGAAPIRFRDATETSGIHFVHTDGSSGKRYIVETVASGLGLIDFDGDEIGRASCRERV